MALKIKVKRSVDHTLFSCSGTIFFGKDVELLKEEVSLAASGTVILNLGLVERIDAAGLGALVYLSNWARDAGIALHIVNASSSLLRLLELTNLDILFPHNQIAIKTLQLVGSEEKMASSLVIDLKKALRARCPKCGESNTAVVGNYHAALKASNLHSFQCSRCDMEFSVPKSRVICDVVAATMPALQA